MKLGCVGNDCHTPEAHQMTTMSRGTSCGPCLSAVEQAAASTAQQELVAADWSMGITLAFPYPEDSPDDDDVAGRQLWPLPV
jgi:hypothetical protein